MNSKSRINFARKQNLERLSEEEFRYCNSRATKMGGLCSAYLQDF